MMKNTKLLVFCFTLVVGLAAYVYFYMAPGSQLDVWEISNRPFIVLESGDFDEAIILFYQYEDFLNNNPESVRVNRTMGLWQCYLFLSRIYLVTGNDAKYEEYMRKSVFYLKRGRSSNFYRNMSEIFPEEETAIDLNNRIFNEIIIDRSKYGFIEDDITRKLLRVSQPISSIENMEESAKGSN